LFQIIVLCHCGETETDVKDINVAIKLYNTGVVLYSFTSYIIAFRIIEVISNDIKFLTVIVAVKRISGKNL
jgi:hypothetical protein